MSDREKDGFSPEGEVQKSVPVAHHPEPSPPNQESTDQDSDSGESSSGDVENQTDSDGRKPQG